jgi:hypothetical protein
MRIQETKTMRIHADADADADPQHCFVQKLAGKVVDNFRITFLENKFPD